MTAPLVIDLLLIVSIFVVCGGVGLPIALLLPDRFAWRGLLAPTLGYGVLAVAVPIAYRSGVSIRAFYFSSVAIALVIVILCARRIARSLREAPHFERRALVTVAAIGIAATLVMLAPRWAGGDRFSAFQGNTWDTYGYLQSAVVYAREPYNDVVNANQDEFARNPLLAMAQASLVNRPSVHQLYAVFSRVAPGQAHRLHYAFLVFSLSQFVLVALFVLRSIFPTKSLGACAAVAGVFPLGFWGQYVFDINAWSQLASIPALFLIFGLAIDIAVHEETELRAGARIAAVLAIAVAGALYLYPEGFVIYAAAMGPVAGVPVLIRAIRNRRLVGLVPLVGFAGVLSAALYLPTWDFLVVQLTRTSVTNAPWWEYFQIFFLGRDGTDGPSTVDFTGSFFGLYFATPTSKASLVMAVLARAAIVAAVLAIIVGVGAMIAGRFVRRDVAPDARARIIAWSVSALLLLGPAVVLVAQTNYWAAGKCVSYAAPVFMTLFCLPMIASFTSRGLRVARWLVIAFVAFQLMTSVARAYAAWKHGHYARPYPGILDPGLKKNLPWDLSAFEDVLTPKTRVLVRVPDVWPRAHVLVFLQSRGVPFAIEGPVSTYFDSGIQLGPRSPPWVPDVELVQEHWTYVLNFRDGRAPIRIVAKR